MGYAVLKDAVRTSVASYSLGSGSLTVAAGTGAAFPVPTAAAPILFTVVSVSSYATYPESYATYQATGVVGDTFTGLTLISGNDMAWAAGAIIEMRTNAKHINDLEQPFVGSGSTHAPGLVPDPGPTAGISRFLREDAQWAAPPGGGGGGGGSGVVGAGTAGQLAGYLVAGTTVGGVNVASVSIATSQITGVMPAAQVPHLVGSGTTHAPGIVPDPGPTAGTTRFLREDAAWAVPPSGSGGGGSGTVAAGTAGQFAGYGAAGTAVAGMTTGLTLTQHTTAAVVPTVTAGSVPIDLSASDLHGPVAMTGNCTLVFNNPPVAGLTQTFRVLMKQAASGGPFSLAYPSGVVWVGSSSGPDMTAVPAGQTLEVVFTYLSSGLILGHYPGATNTDPPSSGGGGSSTITESSETASFAAVAGGFYAVSGSAAVTATLPTAVGIAGQTVRVRCVPGYTGLCTIAAQSGQTITGQAARIIVAGESPLLQSDGANWVRTGGAVIACSCLMSLGTSQSIVGDGNQHTLLFDTIGAGSTHGMGNTGSNGINLIRPGNYRVSVGISIGTILATNFIMFTQAYSSGSASPSGSGLRVSSASVDTNFGIAGSAVGFVTGGAAGDLITVLAYQTNSDTNSYPFDTGNFLMVEEILSW